jgi:hypothetical protein
MKDSNAVHLALRTRAATATGYPAAAQRAYEVVDFTPTSGTAYVEEQFVPATQVVQTLPAATGSTDDRGLYVILVYGPIGEAGRVAIRAIVDGLLAALSAAWSIGLSNGDAVRVLSNPIAPSSGQVNAAGKGWAYCKVTIPWSVYSTNAVLP